MLSRRLVGVLLVVFIAFLTFWAMLLLGLALTAGERLWFHAVISTYPSRT